LAWNQTNQRLLATAKAAVVLSILLPRPVRLLVEVEREIQLSGQLRSGVCPPAGDETQAARAAGAVR
jgi:hypothetical protein